VCPLPRGKSRFFGTILNMKWCLSILTLFVTPKTHYCPMEANTINTQWTDENIVDLVRKLRNDLIKDFLDERYLKEYLNNQFRIRELPNVKIEFIKRDLKELLISPINVNHYEPLISHIKNTDSAALTENNEQLFYKELENIFKSYIY
jgi:hypothetical protein